MKLEFYWNLSFGEIWVPMKLEFRGNWSLVKLKFRWLLCLCWLQEPFRSLVTFSRKNIIKYIHTPVFLVLFLFFAAFTSHHPLFFLHLVSFILQNIFHIYYSIFSTYSTYKDKFQKIPFIFIYAPTQLCVCVFHHIISNINIKYSHTHRFLGTWLLTYTTKRIHHK